MWDACSREPRRLRPVRALDEAASAGSIRWPKKPELLSGALGQRHYKRNAATVPTEGCSADPARRGRQAVVRRIYAELKLGTTN
jgi:hypothetical protein